MENSAATIHCSNSRCQAANGLKEQFCHQCGTPLLKRYLWALRDALKGTKPGTLVGDRYRVIKSSLVLDTKPALPPEIPQDIPEKMSPYLRLAPYRLFVPQVYGQVSLTQGRKTKDVWLLEYGLPRLEKGFANGNILPALSQVWDDADALRQLNWLWQMAQLCQPLHSQGVISSLLKPTNLRVNGPVFQLLELKVDEPSLNPSVYLRKLGALWSQWVDTANPSIQGWLEQLCLQLQQGQIQQPEVLVAILDEALAECGRSQIRNYTIAARTDSGRTRHHNEDACYPPHGSVKEVSDAPAFAIVCDGVGGHDGGEIASQLAIEAMEEGVKNISVSSDHAKPDLVTQALENSTCTANDIISERNDAEKRSDRRRMGTTLVMTLAHAHEMYVNHVGDSRVYWITRTGCYQVTLDDDLASRELRLGYALYRDAIQYPSSGALVQALGMSSSSNLHPNVQRLVLDEDCIFLLCSDGLSDFDRVEQHWETALLPILNGKKTVEEAVEQLIQIGNTQNGHDNITVALVHAQVQPSDQAGEQVLSLPNFGTVAPSASEAVPTSGMNTVNLSAPPEETATQKRSYSSLPLLILVILFGLGVGAYFVIVPNSLTPLEALFSRFRGDSPVSTSPPASPVATPPSPVPIKPTPGMQLQLQESLNLLNGDPQFPEQLEPIATIPAGSIVGVVRTPESGLVRLQVCSVGTNSEAEINGTAVETGESVSRGMEGWILGEEINDRTARKLSEKESENNCIQPPSADGVEN